MRHSSFFYRLDMTARRLAPQGTIFALMLIELMPAHIPAYTTISPWLSLGGVFYWSIHRPDLLSMPAIFAFGLLHDVLTGIPLGCGTLIMLAAYHLSVSQKRFFLGKSFIVAWWGYAMMTAGSFLGLVILVAFVQSSFVPVKGVLFEYFLTAALYPPIAWFCAKIHLRALHE